MTGYEVVTPVPENDQGPPHLIVGETTHGLGEHLVRSGTLQNAEAYGRIRGEAMAIVQRCRPFGGADGTRTGLVVGYVQSGKTLSMTTVSAIARDNGCRVIVLLAGVTKNLLRQSAERFSGDLRAASGSSTVWRIRNSEDAVRVETDLPELQRAVAEWRDPSFDDNDRQTFLFVVLKNYAHLDRLATLLRDAALGGIPALIFDDEADQAGLNTKPGEEDEPSTTYEHIRRVRSALPNHTYLQYTATPQAPLLISLDDMLSPEFSELVEPGEGYTGGLTFFGPRATPGIVRNIPTDQLFGPGEPPHEPPESLLESLRIFFMGAALARIQGAPRPRSMLVHPSPRRSDHARFFEWIHGAITRWSDALRAEGDPDRTDTLEEFRAAYNDLARTNREVPPFDSLVRPLQLSLGRASLKQVNSDDGSEVDWENADEHVLVGGDKLNRGYTVKGLTVTYMPRDAGDWNADTIQQRARFFGYKASYLGLCRLFLHPDVATAYRDYVRHEADIRQQLSQHRGQPLRAWRRAFFLDARLRPTRRNVLLDPYYSVARTKLWFVPRFPHTDPDMARRNSARVTLLRNQVQFHREADFHDNLVASVPLAQIFEQVLLEYEARGPDAKNWYAHVVALRDVLDSQPQAEVMVLQMREGRVGERSAKDLRLHQGKTGGSQGYPGDQVMCAPGEVTIQVHRVRVDGPAGDFEALAVHIPRSLRRDDVGVQPGQAEL